MTFKVQENIMSTMIEKRDFRDVPEVNLSSYAIDPKVLKLIPASLAQKK